MRLFGRADRLRELLAKHAGRPHEVRCPAEAHGRVRERQREQPPGNCKRAGIVRQLRPPGARQQRSLRKRAGGRRALARARGAPRPSGGRSAPRGRAGARAWRRAPAGRAPPGCRPRERQPRARAALPHGLAQEIEALLEVGRSGRAPPSPRAPSARNSAVAPASSACRLSTRPHIAAEDELPFADACMIGHAVVQTERIARSAISLRTVLNTETNSRLNAR